MNEDVVCTLILKSQCSPIESTVLGIPLTCIHVVNRQDDLLPQELVVEHQQGSIEKLKFVIPKNMKQLRFCGGCISAQPDIEQRNSRYFFCKVRFRPLVASEIQKIHSALTMKFRTVEIIAPDQIHCGA